MAALPLQSQQTLNPQELHRPQLVSNQQIVSNSGVNPILTLCQGPTGRQLRICRVQR